MLATRETESQTDPDEQDERVLCDHCHQPVDVSGPHTRVGSSVYHAQPNCYLRKLLGIRRPA